jgi:hypothetical protein
VGRKLFVVHIEPSSLPTRPGCCSGAVRTTLHREPGGLVRPLGRSVVRYDPSRRRAGPDQEPARATIGRGGTDREAAGARVVTITEGVQFPSSHLLRQLHRFYLRPELLSPHAVTLVLFEALIDMVVRSSGKSALARSPRSRMPIAHTASIGRISRIKQTGGGPSCSII